MAQQRRGAKVQRSAARPAPRRATSTLVHSAEHRLAVLTDIVKTANSILEPRRVIELIMAWILDTQGKADSVEQGFRRFLLYTAQSGLKEKIQFAENTAPFKEFTDPVVILDPVYSLNNVASRITEDERQQIVAAAQQSWEAAHFASAEGDAEVWKELFGPRFKIELAA